MEEEDGEVGEEVLGEFGFEVLSDDEVPLADEVALGEEAEVHLVADLAEEDEYEE